MALSFCSSPAGGGDPGDGGGGGGPSGGGTPVTDNRFTAVINGNPYTLTISGDQIILNFPYSLRDGSPYTITIADDPDINALTAGISLVLAADGSSNEITAADALSISSTLKSAIAAKKSGLTFLDAVPFLTPLHTVASYGGIGDINGNLWTANAATLSSTGPAVGITVTWDNAGTAGVLDMPQEFKDRLDASNTVTVTFTKGTSDRIRFDRISELRQALIAEGVSAGAITMKSSAVSGQEVAPLFNGDDLFTNNGNASGKVFGLYTNGQTIYDGFTVKNSSGNGWHIDNTGGKRIFVERLKFKVGVDSGTAYLSGFGLKSALTNIEFVNPTITGQTSSGSGTGIITPADLTTALANLGITSAANVPTSLFNIESLALSTGYMIGSDKNLVSYPVVLGLLEKYFVGTDNRAKLAGLTMDTMGGSNIIVKGSTVPYTNNNYSTANQVNGNLAVWLLTKGVDLKEAYLTNPSLFTSNPTYTIGAVRNVVLDGNNWKNIQISGSGVIVSVNTPAYSIDGGNANLWYVVQGGNPSTQVQINAKVLELGYSYPYANLVPPAPVTLDGLITPTSNRTGLSNNFSATKHYYAGSPNNARPTITWQQYAATVAAGNTPTFALAPMDRSIRMAKADKFEEYGEWLRKCRGVSHLFSG